MKKDLTTGSVFKNIIYFSLPYMLSYFLQTLYGMADLFIVGRFNGTQSITAVSIGSQVMHMLTVMIVGLAMGTTVTVGRAIGEKQNEKAGKAVGSTVTVFMAGSIVLTVVLLLLVKPIVSVMSTPAEAVEETRAYLTICFIGIPFITAYNIISSIFRGLGDSKNPMYFIAVACVFNIALDYLFIGYFKMGAAGAALGTTLSQTVSVIVSLIAMKKLNIGIKLKKTDFKPDKKTVGSLFKIGVPVAAQDGFIQISFLIITIIANGRGLTDAAAVGIVEKIIGMMFIIPSSMLSSVSALAAQNIGAKEYGRAKQTLKYAIMLATGIGLVIAVITQFFALNIVGIFEKDPEVIAHGAQYLRSYVFDCVFAGIHFCFSGYFCAMERSGISFLHNSLSIVFVRIPMAYLMSKMFTQTLFPMGLAATCGSVLSVIICVIAYVIITRKTAVAKNQGAEQERTQ